MIVLVSAVLVPAVLGMTADSPVPSVFEIERSLDFGLDPARVGARIIWGRSR